MCDFFCHKCNKKFDKKFNLTRHLNKKIPCISINIIKSSTTLHNNIHDSNIFQHIPNNSNIFQNSENECKFCLKIYSQVYNLNKHLKVCKIKKQHENDKEEIFKQLIDQNNKQKQLIEQNNKQEKMLTTALEQIQVLTAELTKLKSKTTSIKNSNNTINSNNTTNIVMMDFGKEDLQIIDKEEFIKIVKNNKITGVKITDELLKAIHFNDKYPQLNNIYISDINRQKCMIVENNQWKLSPVDQIPRVIDNIIKYSYDNNEKLSVKYKDNQSIIDRLKVIDKYTKLSDPDHLENLIDEEAPKKDIQRCKNYQQHTYDTIKTTLYNQGKKLKSIFK
jgi:hypothetical protein